VQVELGFLRADYDALDTTASDLEDELGKANVTISDLRFQLAHAPEETFRAYRRRRRARAIPRAHLRILLVLMSFSSAPFSACPFTFCETGSITRPKAQYQESQAASLIGNTLYNSHAQVAPSLWSVVGPGRLNLGQEVVADEVSIWDGSGARSGGGEAWRLQRANRGVWGAAASGEERQSAMRGAAVASAVARGGAGAGGGISVGYSRV